MRNTKNLFQVGNAGGGRPKGSRSRFANSVFNDVLRHWNEPAAPGSIVTKGNEALETMYKEKPHEYVRAVLSLMPKEFAIESTMSDMSDDQLDELMLKIREALVTGKAEEERPHYDA